MRFYESLRPDFKLTVVLRWSYMLENVTEVQVGPLMRSLEELGFPEIEPLLDEQSEGRFLLWFAETCTHTAESFAQRVAALEAFAASNDLVLSDYSAERESANEEFIGIE